MLNLIGNSCAASFIMNDTDKADQGLINPFSYNVIDFTSFKNLITHFYDIDFDSIELIRNETGDRSILVDSKILLNYPHYIFRKDVAHIKDERNHNVYSKDIDTYTLDRYNIRLSRMRSFNIEPMFLAAAVEGKVNDYNEDQLIELLNLDVPYKIIVASKKSINFRNSDNREFIKIEHWWVKTDGRPLGDLIWRKSKLLNSAL